MKILYLLLIIICNSFQSVFYKAYMQKTSGRGVYLFSLLTSAAALLFFLFTSNGFNWDTGLLLYAIPFAAAYITGTVFNVLAVAHGPLSLTALVVSYSLIIPTFFGLIFLKDPVGMGFFPGLILLMISLVLINKKSGKIRITPKWILFVALAFTGNGMCTVVQKTQQLAFDGKCKNEFMIISLAIVAVVLFFLTLFKERQSLKSYIKPGWYLSLACGTSNGVVNLFVMILSGLMPVSIMFPLISAGGIAATYAISKFLYKENLTKQQFIGLIIGIASIICLNI